LREATYDLALGLAVNNALTFSIKLAVRRERPDGGDFGFPSGHASNMFTVATILGHHYGPKISVPLFGLATFVSVSRMDLNSHWLSDTVAGAGLGILVGYSVLRGRKPLESERFTWMPVFPRGGIGVQLFFRP
jgi:membrane-associated phospholipid phosphatase